MGHRWNGARRRGLGSRFRGVNSNFYGWLGKARRVKGGGGGLVADIKEGVRGGKRWSPNIEQQIQKQFFKPCFGSLEASLFVNCLKKYLKTSSGMKE